MLPPDVNDRLAKLAGKGNGGACLYPRTYWKCSPRILWVLRETNGLRAGRSLYDLFRDEMWNEHVWGSIWRRVGLCSYGILNDGMAFKEVDPARVGYGKAFKGLGCIAATNAKKAPGRWTADTELVLEAFLADGAVFQKEMALLQPDLVICGGTWEVIAGWIGYRQGTFRRHPESPRQKAKYWALDLAAETCKSIFGYKPMRGRITFFWAGHPAGRSRTGTYYRDTVQGALWAIGRAAK